MGDNELERLIVRLMGDGSSYQRMIGSAQKVTSQFTDQLRFHTAKIQGFGLTLRGWGNTALGTAAGYASVLGIGAGINAAQGAVSRFMEAEQTEIAFEALIGNAELAKSTLADLRKFAAETPFESPEIMAAAKQMIAFGETADNIVPTMKSLGDVSAGLNIPLGQLTYLFGTLKAQGRAMTVDINQFAMRGIPIWKELEKQTGKSNAEVRKMVEQGQVGFPMIEQAFKNMTAEGGLFHGQLQKQSQSLSGLVSTLKDNVGMVLSDVGKKLVETFNVKEVIKQLGDAAQEAGRWITFIADKAVEAGQAIRDWVGTTGVENVRKAADAVRGWAAANQQLVARSALVVGALTGVYAAYRLVRTAVFTTTAALAMLKFQWVAGAMLMAAYKAVLLAVSFASAVYSATLWSINAALAAASFAAGVFSTAETVSTVATWLLNGALFVLSAELIVPLIAGLIAAGIVLAAFGFALGVVAASGYAVYKGVGAALDVILAIPTAEGPVKAVSDLFNQWGANLKRIAAIAEKDLPAAFELLKLQAQVAVEQVKLLWPPLFEFILKVSEVTWREAKGHAVTAFAEAIDEMWKMVKVFSLQVARGVSKGFAGAAVEEMYSFFDDAGAEVGKAVEGGVKSANVGKHFKLELKDALDKFREQMKGLSPEIDALNKRITDALELAELKQKWRDQWAKMGFSAAQFNKDLGASVTKDLKIVPKFDQTEWGGFEASRRIQEWSDKLRAAGANNMDVVQPSKGGGANQPLEKMANGWGTTNKILGDIRDRLAGKVVVGASRFDAGTQGASASAF